MCLLSLLGDPGEGQLTAALAGVFSVPVESVDVHVNEVIDRNWQAPVLCSVRRFDGDLPQQLDIYLADSVSRRPSDEVLATESTERLGCATAYELEVPTLPCYHWIVGTDGRRTRADISEHDREDDEPPFYRIDAVEHPVAGTPGFPIAAIPGIINDYPAEEYGARLEYRDALVTLADKVPASVRADLDEALTTLDRRFTETTVNDGGQALTSRVGPIPDRWRWRRITQPLPWHRIPGEGC